jgi:hypothetical protein
MRCGVSVRAGLKEAIGASWWRTKVKRRKAFLGGRAVPQRRCPVPVVAEGVMATRSRHGDDLLDRRRVGRVLLALVSLAGDPADSRAWSRVSGGDRRRPAARMPWILRWWDRLTVRCYSKLGGRTAGRHASHRTARSLSAQGRELERDRPMQSCRRSGWRTRDQVSLPPGLNKAISGS